MAGKVRDNWFCPECGEDLKDLDIIAHRNAEFGEICPEPAKYPQAAERWQELTKMAEEKGG
jgi:hypothetical protein